MSESENNIDIKSLTGEYVESLDKLEKIAYNIAVKNLESSFDIEKCIGFQKWLKSKKNK
tara:strand:+ start:349 stop:525 length:177 start_codon:yes stop_codon:yes gene_type:complete